MEKVDFIVVGQGLAGSTIAYTLLQHNKKILIIDETSGATSSRQATGLINPITGRRFVKSWLTEQLMPYAKIFYTTLEKQHAVSFFKETKQVKILHSAEQQNDFHVRMQEQNYTPFLSISKEKLENIYKTIEAVETSPIYQIDINKLQDFFLNYFQEKNCLHKEEFAHQNLKEIPNGIEYKGIQAKHIVFAEGYLLKNNPFFNFVPEHHTKGEAFEIECTALNIDFVLNSFINITPTQQNQYYIGATYDWNDLTPHPTTKKKKDIIERWQKTTSLPYILKEHKVGIRPTTVDRRPLLGKHPTIKNMYIFNGMGTKGLSLAPYFANHLVEHILHNKPLLPEVNILRFYGK